MQEPPTALGVTPALCRELSFYAEASTVSGALTRPAPPQVDLLTQNWATLEAVGSESLP